VDDRPQDSAASEEPRFELDDSAGQAPPGSFGGLPGGPYDGGLPPGGRRGPPGPDPFEFVGWLYTANPFYLLSVLLVMYGLHRAFAHGVLATHSWDLMGMLGGYTLLLAGTALCLVRFGRIWDDARMILLLVVLLFMALAVSFDEVVATQVITGRWLLGTGLILSLSISEALFRGLPIRLPWAYRAPYYLMLALFFLYPLALAPLRQQATDDNLRLAVAAFGLLAAGAFLLLIPAVRRGAEGVALAGAPWPWPQFPWSLFVFLAFGLGVRTYYLTISFVPGTDLNTFWRPYLLAPLALAWATLVLEAGLRRQRVDLQYLAHGLAGLAVVFALPWVDGFAHREFVQLLSGVAASPPCLALVGASAFYLYAWVRGARGADSALTACVAALAWTSPTSANLLSLDRPELAPLAAATLVALGAAVQRRTSTCAFVASSLAALTVYAALADTSWASLRLELAGQLQLSAALLIGLVWSDPFARSLRWVAAVTVMLLAAMVAVTPALSPAGSRGWLPTVCLALWAASSLAIGWRWRDGSVFFAGLVASLSVVLSGGKFCYALLAATYLGRGLDLLVWGLASLAVGMAISLGKAGVWQRAAERLGNAWR
jgi:hypothetical protein